MPTNTIFNRLKKNSAILIPLAIVNIKKVVSVEAHDFSYLK